MSTQPSGYDPRRNDCGLLLPPHRYVDDLVNLACDLVTIPNLEPDVPPEFVPGELIRAGRVGFLNRDDPSRGFYASRELGHADRYHQPTLFSYEYTINGSRRTFRVSTSDGACDIKANATATPPVKLFERYAAELEICDRSIAANIRAQIYGRILTTDDPSKREKLNVLLSDVESGRPLVLSRDEVEMLQSVDITVPVTFDSVIAARASIWSDAMKRVGSVSPSQYRRERTQTAEVQATIAETIDDVYVMIDTFNRTCERLGLIGIDGKPYRMEYNGYAAQFDEAEPQEAPETDGDEGGGENG